MFDILYRNHWLWMHILGGGFLTVLFYNFIPKLKGNKKRCVLALVSVAVTWEVVEYYTGVDAYSGGVRRFFLDGLQDILGALVAGLFVVWRKP